MDKESPAAVRVFSGLPALAGDARGDGLSSPVPDAAHLQAKEDYLSARARFLDEHVETLSKARTVLLALVEEQRQRLAELDSFHRSLERWHAELTEFDPRMGGTVH